MKRPARPRDPSQLGKLILDIATGARPNHSREVRAEEDSQETAAVALHFTHYNFARIHKTLRVTPAMEAGVSDHVCSLEEIAGLV